MKITADTNILIRIVTEDDPGQSRTAQRIVAEASVVAIPMPVLTEFCWVLDRLYKIGREDIARAVRTITAGENVVVDAPAVSAGLAMLEAGGDFADGVIAHDGKWLGAETFVSFDRKAVKLLGRQGEKVMLLE